MEGICLESPGEVDLAEGTFEPSASAVRSMTGVVKYQGFSLFDSSGVPSVQGTCYSVHCCRAPLIGRRPAVARSSLTTWGSPGFPGCSFPRPQISFKGSLCYSSMPPLVSYKQASVVSTKVRRCVWTPATLTSPGRVGFPDSERAQSCA